MHVRRLDARLTGDLVISLLPSYYVTDVELDLRQRILGVGQGDVVNLSAAFQQGEVSFRGKLSVGLKYVGRQDATFDLSFRTFLPSTDELNQAILFLQPPLPRK